tara:strand:- start:370 stop:1260 length:891 start_codon:yes stop_codon:yes gene_type:complete
MSFADFKKRSKNSISDLAEKMEKMDEKKSYQDDRFWKPELDKSSNGYAVIRFLPGIELDQLPFAKYYSHGFKGIGGWYIENSRTTLGENDPVSEMNSKLWNSGIESDKDIARSRKRKTNYVSNIYIVSDPANPENEGKVFLYRFGQRIFDKIKEATNPEFADEEKINPFDPVDGANFKLKVRKVAGYINYDKSEFASQEALFDDESQIEAIWDKQYKISEFTDPSKFKSYDELKIKLYKVIGSDIRASAPTETKTAEDVKMEVTANESSSSNNDNSGDEAEASDALSYFEKLASDD